MNNVFTDGSYIPGPRHVFVYCHQVDETHGILRFVYGAVNENLAVNNYD